jgi:HD-GYP domain-containing protein (c-di-GMP phosphodiesterase class II)
MKTYSTSKKIAVTDLQVGMFVSSLEVAWSSTDYPLQGTLVRNRQDILKISSYGRTVTIDQSRSSANLKANICLPDVQKTRNTRSIRVHKQVQRPWRKFCKQDYQSKKPIAQEISHAKILLYKVEDAFRELTLDLKQLTPQKIETIQTVSNEIVLSLIDNPDALLWLTKVKVADSTIYEHTLRASIWATLMGRSMGLKTASLFALNQAILLSGIGKSYLDKRIWKNYQPTKLQSEFALCSNITIEKLSHSKDINPQVLSIIANMAERFDGSGYPLKKKDKEIPYLSQIAGLVESFDLILNPPLSRKRLTVGQALSKLYCLADTLFDGALIEELIQAIGLYPSGTQVLLSDGSLGVVIEQSKSRRIRATVALTHNKEGYRLLNYKVVNLGEDDYENILINKESKQHQIVNEDVSRINLLIKKQESNKLSQLFLGLKNYLSN